MLNGTEKTPPLITDYREYHTDTTVKFIVKMTEEKLSEVERAGLHKVFKLQTSLTCNSMVRLPVWRCALRFQYGLYQVQETSVAVFMDLTKLTRL